MTTPVYDEFVRLIGDTTLHLGTALMMCRKFEDLRSAADSTNQDLDADGLDGVIARARRRGGLTAQLTDIQIDGRYDDDGAEVAGDPVENAVSTLRTLIGWPDDQTDRRFTVELTEFGDVYQGDAAFESWGKIRRPVPHIFEVSAAITVAEGRLALVVP